jgi:hypothetical protein
VTKKVSGKAKAAKVADLPAGAKGTKGNGGYSFGVSQTATGAGAAAGFRGGVNVAVGDVNGDGLMSSAGGGGGAG